jgi:methylated-DNA-[protein]-cysteine S-methyltransferase
MEFLYHHDSPLGKIVLSSDGDALTGAWFEDQKYFPDHFRNQPTAPSLPVFDAANEWLTIYFSGKVPSFLPPLSLQTTPFRKSVLELLLQIPYGHTTTYREISRQVARQMGVATMSAQAVGGAVGHNPLSLFIPCHRVIGSNGSLTGYAGGLNRKIELLKLEGVDISNLMIP